MSIKYIKSKVRYWKIAKPTHLGTFRSDQHEKRTQIWYFFTSLAHCDYCKFLKFPITLNDDLAIFHHFKTYFLRTTGVYYTVFKLQKEIFLTKAIFLHSKYIFLSRISMTPCEYDGYAVRCECT